MKRPLSKLLGVALGGLAFLAMACPGEEEKTRGDPPEDKVSSAARTFLDFAHGQAPIPNGGGSTQHEIRFSIVKRELVAGRRPLRRLTLELPLQVKAGEVEATLRAVARDPTVGPSALLEVLGFPGSLRHLSGPFASLTLARDGLGVPGTQGKNELLRVAKRLGTELDLEETRAIFAMDRAYGAKHDARAALVAGQGAGLEEDRAEALVEKVRDHYPPARVR